MPLTRPFGSSGCVGQSLGCSTSKQARWCQCFVRSGVVFSSTALPQSEAGGLVVEDTTERIEKLSCCYLVFDAVGKLKCNHFDECDECMF